MRGQRTKVRAGPYQTRAYDDDGATKQIAPHRPIPRQLLAPKYVLHASSYYDMHHGLHT
jgi:hypothetical protein